MPVECIHLDQIQPDVKAVASGCVECLATGGEWVHLRRCLTCGHIGCCDDSPNTHARKHAAQTGHFLMQSFEPEEEWVYCFMDGAFWETIADVPAR